MLKFKYSPICLAFALSACGGGSGDSTTPSSPPASTDSQAPSITVSGGNSIQITVGDDFVNPEATVTDNVDSGLTATVSGSVDNNTIGTYELTYTATDSAGNTSSVIVTVTVVAIENNTPPVNTVIDTAKPGTDRILSFSTSDEGVDKSIDRWGLDTAWLSESNMVRGARFMGTEQVDVARLSFRPTHSYEDGVIPDLPDTTDDPYGWLQNRLDIIDKVNPDMDVVMNSDHPSIADWFIDDNGDYIPEHWEIMMRLTKEAAEERGHSVLATAIYNEPDCPCSSHGGKDGFLATAKYMREETGSYWNNVDITGGNTLSPEFALEWYEYLKDYLDEGNTHQLAGSFDDYANFYTQVVSDGRRAVNDELHNVMEAMVGAEYGMETGIWWYTAEYTRGEFVKTSDGKRLAYAEHRPNWTAASVYRAPDGHVQAFVGSSERQATTTTYKVVTKDRAVYFDGYGPTHQFNITAEGGSGYQANQMNAEAVYNVTWGDDIQPAVTTGRYIVVNKDSQQVLEVQGFGQNDGDNIQQGDYVDELGQQWDIEALDSRNGEDYSYFKITNANASDPDNPKSIDVYNWSLDDGGDLRQWGYGNGRNQHWYLKYVGDSYFSICSRHSAYCLETNGSNVQQGINENSDNQLWRLIPADAAVEFTPPDVPMGLTASAQSESVLLSWEANVEDDLAGYTLLRSETENGSYDTIARHIPSTNFVDNTTVTGQTYFYKLVAEDASRNRSGSSVAVSAASTGEAGLVAHFSFESDTYDNSVNDNHAAISDEMTYTAGVEDSFAIRFSGTGQFLQLPATVANHDELTISLWVNWDGGANEQMILQFANDETEYFSLTPQSDNSKMALTLTHQGVTDTLEATPVSQGQWTQIAIVFTNDIIELYQNGVLVAENADTSLRPNNFKPVVNMIGTGIANSAQLFEGSMDDFRIYNSALSATQINDLYQQNQ